MGRPAIGALLATLSLFSAACHEQRATFSRATLLSPSPSATASAARKPSATAKAVITATPRSSSSRPASPTPSPQAFEYCGYDTPKDVNPASLKVTLRLTKTTYHQGETIHGVLDIQNVSNATAYYWEGYWPVGLLRNGVFVGGFDNAGAITDGYQRYSLAPGQTKEYPRDIDFGGWQGVVDTLACHRTSREPRKLLPPGAYVAMVSFPVGAELQAEFKEGAQGRVGIDIVP